VPEPTPVVNVTCDGAPPEQVHDGTVVVVVLVVVVVDVATVVLVVVVVVLLDVATVVLVVVVVVLLDVATVVLVVVVVVLLDVATVVLVVVVVGVVATVLVVVVVVVDVVVGGHEPEAPPGHRVPIISPQLPQALALPPQSHVPALQALMTALKHPDFAPPERPESATSSLQAV